MRGAGRGGAPGACVHRYLGVLGAACQVSLAHPEGEKEPQAKASLSPSGGSPGTLCNKAQLCFPFRTWAAGKVGGSANTFRAWQKLFLFMP